MIIPRFLKKNDTIGIVALSAGVGHKLESFGRSIVRLEDYFNTYETKSVRVNNVRANNPKQRADEFNKLVNNDSIDFIMIATGGDFLIEVLPYIDWQNIVNNPKFVMGYSDPTFLMYILTTKYDIATIYGLNAGSFDEDNFHPSLRNAIDIMQGNLIEQHSFDKFESNKNFDASAFNLDSNVNWININSEIIDVTGVMIGGCLDVISNIVGTKYDETKEFIKRYPSGLIWFFDVYEMNSITLYITMIKMKYAGYFDNTKAIVFGRILFTQNSSEKEYIELLKKAFDIPIVFNADIGHTAPTMTIINGINTHLYVKEGKGVIKQWL